MSDWKQWTFTLLCLIPFVNKTRSLYVYLEDWSSKYVCLSTTYLSLKIGTTVYLKQNKDKIFFSQQKFIIFSQ